MKLRKAKVQGYRRFGYLWRAAVGPTPGHVEYGYGTTRRAATASAKGRYETVQFLSDNNINLN